MPSLGPLEILVVAVVALLVFGPEKLPEIARTVGRAAAQMRRMASEFRDEFQAGLDVHEDVEDEPAARRGRPGEASGERTGDGTAGAAGEAEAPGRSPDGAASDGDR